jgi:hypothetical protein
MNVPAIADEASFLSGLVDGGLLAASDVNRLARTQAETGEQWRVRVNLAVVPDTIGFSPALRPEKKAPLPFP